MCCFFVLKVLIFKKQNLHLFKDNNTNYTRKRRQPKPVSHSSAFSKSHLQYNARKLRIENHKIMIMTYTIDVHRFVNKYK